MNYQDLISQAEKQQNYWKINIIECVKNYIEANDALRKNPCGWTACHPSKDTPEGEEYYRLNENYQDAYSKLWMTTDVEYNEDGFRDVIWNWRYWKIMARKCCWYQKLIPTYHLAAETMRNLQDAENKLIEVCGLTEIYKSSSYYIEKQFPNLKK